MDWSTPVRAVIPGLEGPVLAVLADAEEPLTGSEVHRRAGTGSNAGVRLALERLVAVGTVTARPAGGAILYAANREHLAWPAIQAALDAFDPHRELRRRLVALLERSVLPAAALAIQAVPERRGRRSAPVTLHVVVVVPDDAMADDVELLSREIETRVRLWTGNAVAVHAATATTTLRDMDQAAPVTSAWDAHTREQVRREAERLRAG